MKKIKEVKGITIEDLKFWNKVFDRAYTLDQVYEMRAWQQYAY